MHMGNPVVMLLDERDRGNIVACDEVPEIHVRAVMPRERKRLLPMIGRRGGMAMISHHELVLVRKLPEAFEFVVFP